MIQNPPQVVRFFSWQALVDAVEQATEFPVVYAFGDGQVGDYVSIGEVSKVWTGSEPFGPTPLSANASRRFVQIAPYDWVTS